MSSYLNQDGGHSQEIEVILGLPQEVATRVVSHVVGALDGGSKPDPFADKLHALIAESCEQHQASGILRHVFWIGSICSRETKEAHTVIEELSDELTRSDWSSEDTSKWRNSAITLCEIVVRKEFIAARKAIELSYDYANVFSRAKILTDIRPVFSDDGEEIMSSVVSFCLRLNYHTGNDFKDLAIVLDDQEVNDLKIQCERALAKSKKAADLMKAIDVPSSIAGNRDN